MAKRPFRGKSRRRNRAQRRSKLTHEQRFRLRVAAGKADRIPPRKRHWQDEESVTVQRTATTIEIYDGHPLSPYRAAR